MKKITISIILLFFIFNITLFLFIPFGKADLTEIDYTFNNNVLIDSAITEFDDTFNIRNFTKYTGHYNATYSFENNDDGSNPSDWYIDESGGSIQIISGIYNHDKVLEFNDSSSIDNIFAYNDFDTPQISGIIEFWFLTIDNTQRIDFDLYLGLGGGGGSATDIFVDGGNLYHYNGSFNIIIPVLNNIWYHLKYDFNSNIDSLDVYVNTILEVDKLPYTTNNTNIKSFKVSSSNSEQPKTYIDAIGYSWQYTSNNDDYEFTFTEFNDNDEFNPSITPYGNWSYYPDTNTNATIKSGGIDGNFLRYYDNDGTNRVYTTYDFINQTSGVFDFDFRISDNSKEITFWYYDEGIENAIGIEIDNGNLSYWYFEEPATSHNIDLAIINNNQWYNLRIHFDCNIDNYTLYLDDIYLSNCYFWKPVDKINQFNWFSSYTDSAYTMDLDSYSGYSTYLNYSIGTNLLPELITLNYLEVDKTLFYLKEANTLYVNGNDNPSGWNDYEEPPMYDRVNILDNQVYATCEDLNDLRGIAKTFNINGSINLNLIFDLNITTWDDSNNNGFFTIYISALTGYDDIVRLRLFQNGTLCFYDKDTSDFTPLFYGFTTNNIYTFDINYYHELNLVNISYYNNGVYVNQTYIESYTLNVKGVHIIDLYGWCKENGKKMYFTLDNIGVYIDGKSLSDEYGYTTLNLNQSWNTNINNLIYIKANGSIHIGLVESSYTVSETFYTFIDLDYYYNTTILKNGYDSDGYLSNATFVFSFLNSYFTVSHIKIDGVLLVNGSNEYPLIYSHSNIDTYESYFYVDSLHNLKWYLITDDTNTEYIKASFDIVDISTSNYTFGFTSYIDYAYGYVYTNYTTVNQEFEIYSYLNTRYYILAENKSFSRIDILITDNDLDSIIGTSEGYVRDITLFPAYMVSYNLVFTDVLFMFIPLIVVFIPSLLIGYKFKTIIVPMIAIMSIVCFITSLIPIWLLFIIFYGSIVYFIVNRERKGDFI